MEIADLGTQSAAVQEQAAVLLVEGFVEPRGWPWELHPMVVRHEYRRRGRPDIYMSKRLQHEGSRP
jgi:hypothetical protein